MIDRADPPRNQANDLFSSPARVVPLLSLVLALALTLAFVFVLLILVLLCPFLFVAHLAIPHRNTHTLGKGEIKDKAAMENYLKTLKGEQIGCGAKNDSGLVYDGKEALILEWIRPSTAADPCGEQECHTLDIMTVAKPDGHIDVVTFLYWGDCEDGKTSHTTRGGYTVDVAKETIGAKCAWYAPYFAKMVPKKLFSTGHPLPGMGEVCALMIKAHKVAMAEQPWLRMIGWDAMIARSGVVYFEGNYAQMRLPRRVFLTWGNFVQCMNIYVFASLPEIFLMTGIWSALFMYMFNLV